MFLFRGVPGIATSVQHCIRSPGPAMPKKKKKKGRKEGREGERQKVKE